MELRGWNYNGKVVNGYVFGDSYMPDGCYIRDILCSQLHRKNFGWLLIDGHGDTFNLPMKYMLLNSEIVLEGHSWLECQGEVYKHHYRRYDLIKPEEGSFYLMMSGASYVAGVYRPEGLVKKFSLAKSGYYSGNVMLLSDIKNAVVNGEPLLQVCQENWGIKRIILCNEGGDFYLVGGSSRFKLVNGDRVCIKIGENGVLSLSERNPIYY